MDTTAGTISSLEGRSNEAVNSGLTVIGAGFGRTGTSLSLHKALELLGIGPCYDIRDVMKDPDGFEKWLQVADKEPDWDSIFFGYKATVDGPGCNYYQLIMEHYPKAKVILSVGDQHKWVKSVLDTIAPPPTIWAFIYRVTGMENLAMKRFMTRCVWEPFCGDIANARDRDKLIQAFRKHNADVIAHVPKEQLLVWDVTDGWKSLCEFLDKPVPDIPFPNSWDTARFQTMKHARRKKAVLRLMGAGVVLVAAVALGFGKRGSSGKAM
jgi:hypothetical protein